jgi:iron complex outermembrane receptor protein
MLKRSLKFGLLLGMLAIWVVEGGEVFAQERSNGGTAVADTDTLERQEEVIVVTASRKEQALTDAPAAISVFGSEQISQFPVDDYGDLLRNVPGVNVAQTSALDLSIATRNSPGILPQGVLALVDSRAVYQDYNNFVLWVGVPLEFEEIDRIEVLRGPGSAMWGANAADGVVHIITKRPRDSVGTIVKAGGGSLGSGMASAIHTGVKGKWAYRLSGGWVTQDAYEKPTGVIPGTDGLTNPGGTSYPDYENHGLDLFRGNIRVDYDASPATTWSFSGGYAGFEGIFLPLYRYTDGSYNSFGKVDFQHNSIRATFYANIEKARGGFITAPMIPPHFNYGAYNLDVTDLRSAGDRHLLTYGTSNRWETRSLPEPAS